MADTDGTFIVTMIRPNGEQNRLRYQPRTVGEALEYGTTMRDTSSRWSDFQVHQIIEQRIY